MPKGGWTRSSGPLSHAGAITSPGSIGRAARGEDGAGKGRGGRESRRRGVVVT